MLLAAVNSNPHDRQAEDVPPSLEPDLESNPLRKLYIEPDPQQHRRGYQDILLIDIFQRIIVVRRRPLPCFAHSMALEVSQSWA